MSRQGRPKTVISAGDLHGLVFDIVVGMSSVDLFLRDLRYAASVVVTSVRGLKVFESIGLGRRTHHLGVLRVAGAWHLIANHEVVVFMCFVERGLPLVHHHIVSGAWLRTRGPADIHLGRDGLMRYLLGTHGRCEVYRLDGAEVVRRLEAHVDIDVLHCRSHLNSLINTALIIWSAIACS